MMKKVAILLVLVASVSMSQTHNWPFVEGDRILLGGKMYWFQPLPDTTVYARFDSVLDRMDGLLPWDHNRGTPFDGMQIAISRNYPFYPCGVTYNNNFAGVARKTCSELFPVKRPVRDTTWLRQYSDSGTTWIWRYATNVRVFDTTITNIIIRDFIESPTEFTVQAFSVDIYDTSDVFLKRVTVHKYYWLLKQENASGDTVTLDGFKMGSYSKNMGPYTYDFPLLCEQRSHTYKYTETTGWIDSKTTVSSRTWTVRDTVINDTTYYVIMSPNGGPVEPFPHGGNPMRNAGKLLFVRENGVEKTYTPRRLMRGEWNGSMALIGCDSVDYQGLRVKFRYETLPAQSFDNRSILELLSGVGLLNSYNYTEPFGSSNSIELINLVNCPAEPLSIEANIPALPRWQSVVYPSPARESITLSIVHAATAAPLSGALQITDALGRTVLVQQWEEVTERSTLTLPVAGFAPGVYYYRLAGNHAWLAGQFVVER